MSAVALPRRALAAFGALSLAASLLVACSGGPNPSGSGTQAAQAPICVALTGLHHARETFIAAIQSSQRSETSQANALAKDARTEVAALIASISSASPPPGGGQELLAGMTSVAIAIDQGSLFIDGESAPLDARQIEGMARKAVPAMDAALAHVDQLATGSGSVCAGMALAFSPASTLFPGPAVTPGLGTLRLPTEIGGRPLSISVDWVRAGTPLARAVLAAGGSLQTAVVADAAPDGVPLFSVLNVPGGDVAAVIGSFSGDAWPEASRASEFHLDQGVVYRYDTPLDPDVSPATFFLFPRGDALFIFEDASQETVSMVLDALR